MNTTWRKVCRNLTLVCLAMLLYSSAGHSEGDKLLPAREKSSGRLNHSHVGIYGTLFDFCDFSVFKFLPTEDDNRLQDYRRMVHWAYQQGKRNVVGIYGIKEAGITSPRRLDSFLRSADRILSTLDLREVYCVFIDEENVTWNGGLETLNAVYDHIKKRYRIPVYQWLTAPETPHPKLKADGYIWDCYGVRKDEFRRLVIKYLVTGKPLIMCINASPDVALFEEPLVGYESSQDQVDVCREFNIPMFFYAVDPQLGSPFRWLRSDDPTIVKWRSWCLRVMEQARSTDVSRLPPPSAGFSNGAPVEIAGDTQNRFLYRDTFSDLRFVDEATIYHLQNLRYDGEREWLYVPATREKPLKVQMVYHFFSLFDLRDIHATVVGEVDAASGSYISVELSRDGYRWYDGGKQPLETPAGRQRGANGLVPVTLTVPVGDVPVNERGRNFWVRITLYSAPSRSAPRGCALKEFSVSGQVRPPSQRQILLTRRPDQPRRFYYRDDFNSQRCLHLAEIDNVERLEFARGYIATRGVEGYVNTVVLRQRFVATEPLSRIRVRMQNTAYEKSLGAYNVLALSLDGKEKLLHATTAGKEGAAPRYSGVLEIDASHDARFQNVREFWVIIEMHNVSGAKTNTSNTVDWLEVEAYPPDQ